MLTAKKKKEYVTCGYNNCPHCDSDDIDSFYESKDDNWVECKVYCNGCGREWKDIYTLADIQEEEEE